MVGLKLSYSSNKHDSQIKRSKHSLLLHILVMVVEPSDALAHVPLSLLLLARRINEESFAVLLTVEPLAFIGSAIRVGINSVALLFVVEVLSHILTTVWPLVDALAVHVVVQPVARVDSPVVPLVLPVP